MAFFYVEVNLDNATLAFCILIQQRERNNAIGITADTQFLRDMGQFVHSATIGQFKNDTGRLVKIAYLKALLEEYQALAKILTDHITENIDDADTRNEGVYAMTKLESYVTGLGDELEALWPQ